MPIHIYALMDPRDDSVRYIGKTVNPRKRLQGHRKTGHSEVIKAWAAELEGQGLSVKMQTLEVVEDGDDWRVAESYWVRHAIAQGWPILNKVAGGDGVPLRYITDQNPDLRIYRCIRITEATAGLLADVQYMSYQSQQPRRSPHIIFFLRLFREFRHASYKYLKIPQRATFFDNYLPETPVDPSQKEDKLLYAALVQLNIYDQHGPAFYEDYQEHLRAKEHSLPKWQSAPRDSDGDLWLSADDLDAKTGVYNVAIFMKKRTGDLLDELAAKQFNGKRRGYDSTWYAALTLLKAVANKNGG